MKVAEFVAEILLKGSSQAVQDIRKISAGIKDLRLGLVSALKSFDQISQAAREVAVQLDMYQLNTGLSATQLQRLSFQAAQAGVSMNELGGAIQKLQQANAKARLGYGWDPIFSRLGLNPGQNPVEQLNQIGNALRRLQATNPAEAKYLATKAGISDSVYYAMLRGGTEEMDKQLILTQKEQSILVKLNQQWNKFWFYIKQITVKMQVLSANLQTRFLKVLLNAAKGFLELVTRARALIEANDKLKYAIIAVGVVAAAYFAPWLLTLGAIALILEDIWVYFQGGDSLTGRIIEWVNSSKDLKDVWQGLLVILKGVVWAFEMVKGLIETIVGYIGRHPKLAGLLSQVAKQFGPQMVMNAIPGARTLGFVGNISEAVKPNGMVDNSSTVINQTNTAYVTGSNANEDSRTVAETWRENLSQAQGVMPNRANGNKKGGLLYSE